MIELVFADPDLLPLRAVGRFDYLADLGVWMPGDPLSDDEVEALFTAGMWVVNWVIE